jgi:predicted nuclease with TOPRIM domain
MYLYY